MRISDQLRAFTHRIGLFTHKVQGLNIGSDLRFYLISTVKVCGYYYYLYIYKTHFQADRLQITVQPLGFSNINLMSTGATA
jgi:hypothetical protein